MLSNRINGHMRMENGVVYGFSLIISIIMLTKVVQLLTEIQKYADKLKNKKDVRIRTSTRNLLSV